MLQRNGSQLLFLIALCSVLYSRTQCLPYASMRPTRHADGLFTSGYSKLLGQLSARRYLESLIGKRVSDDMMEDQVPVKRHSDAIFTDNYSRFRKQMAVKKFLNSVLTGKRRWEQVQSTIMDCVFTSVHACVCPHVHFCSVPPQCEESQMYPSCLFSQEDPPMQEESRSEPSFLENYDDGDVDHLLNNFQLPL
uniref:Vasoactive intestinal peptide n=1 Tax=Salmo trutta TaxID=8032 RepID=A0A673WB44_SALTR